MNGLEGSEPKREPDQLKKEREKAYTQAELSDKSALTQTLGKETKMSVELPDRLTYEEAMDLLGLPKHATGEKLKSLGYTYKAVKRNGLFGRLWLKAKLELPDRLTTAEAMKLLSSSKKQAIAELRQRGYVVVVGKGSDRKSYKYWKVDKEPEGTWPSKRVEEVLKVFGYSSFRQFTTELNGHLTEDSEVKRANETIRELDLEIAKLKARIELKDEKIAELKDDKIAALESENARLKLKLMSAYQQNDSLQGQVNRLNEVIGRL